MKEKKSPLNLSKCLEIKTDTKKTIKKKLSHSRETLNLSPWGRFGDNWQTFCFLIVVVMGVAVFFVVIFFVVVLGKGTIKNPSSFYY